MNRHFSTCRPPVIASSFFLLLVTLYGVPGTAHGEAAQADMPEPQALPATPQDEPAQPTGVDLAHEYIGRSVDDAAKWFDAFFGDERYVSEEAQSRIRLTPSLFYEEGEGVESRFRVNARIHLPRLSKRLRLVIADTSLDEESILDQETFPGAGTVENASTAIGLQYLVRSMKSANLSITAGLKRGDEHAIDFFIGPRFRKTWAFDSWQLRFTERVRWFADLGWDSRTRLDYERLLKQDLFFRTSSELLWSEEDFDTTGYQLSVTPAVAQRLENRAGIEYQWLNVFNSRPDRRLDSTTLRVRYRQGIWRKWLFYEVNPQVAFRDEDDFDSTAGIELRLEASFGGL